MQHTGNHLRNEKSPYLQQHADNPVDWYPWGKEAFQKAQKENKPIFLSIGYSTCHWCHVMEHESFEDEEIAEILNKHFVSIKVDREERPDVDHVYMQVCQAMTGSGGWPLTVVLTPDKKPFFAGTYFPKESKYGRIGLKELLLKIADLWEYKQKDVIESADQIVTQLRKAQQRLSDHSHNPDSLVEKAIGQLQSSFDEQYGGFGTAPKFPSPHNLLLIMDMEQRNSSEGLDFIVQKTLDNMARGGIRDHIGGGFHRYSTDRFWLVPHFEKMLYDQAMLLMAYAKAHWVYGEDEYKQIAYEIIEYVRRELMENNLFLSAEDADSEGEEGKFYLWTEAELKQILDNDEFILMRELSDISESGNYIDEVHGGKTGKNIIHFAKDINSLLKIRKIDADEFINRYNSIKQKLFNAREKREHPFKDRKVLTDWNGLMITALVKAGIFLDDSALINLARESFDRIVSVFRFQDGHLLHRYIDGQTDIPGKIDDYAWMIQAALQLFYSTQELSYLNLAFKWSKIVLDEFEDKQYGGFFMHSENDESLILKAKELYDGAIPSGNSVMFRNLTDLYFLTAENGYREAIERFLQYAIPEIERYPAGYTFLIAGIERYLNPPGELIIVSEQFYPDLLTQLGEFRKKEIQILWLHEKTNEIVKDIEYFKNYTMLNNQITYYFCRNFTCNLPVNDLELIKKSVQ